MPEAVRVELLVESKVALPAELKEEHLAAIGI